MPRSNTILAAAVFCLAAFLLAGCASTAESKAKKEVSRLTFHVETNASGTARHATVQIYRAHPIPVRVREDASLDEGFMRAAEIVAVDEHGGFGIKITFNEEGARRLDVLTLEHRGRRVAIAAVWTEARWLAAPLISKRITDGVFIFTPDASRAEAERIVHGLNNMIKRLGRPYTIFG